MEPVFFCEIATDEGEFLHRKSSRAEPDIRGASLGKGLSYTARSGMMLGPA